MRPVLPSKTVEDGCRPTVLANSKYSFVGLRGDRQGDDLIKEKRLLRGGYDTADDYVDYQDANKPVKSL
jgi:hypothetical protein